MSRANALLNLLEDTLRDKKIDDLVAKIRVAFIAARSFTSTQPKANSTTRTLFGTTTLKEVSNMKHILKVLAVLLFMICFSIQAYAATVKITWNANTESDLAGYKLYYGTKSGVYTSSIDVKNVTQYTVTVNPTVTTTYYVALTAYDTSGNESVKSDETSITVVVADTTPPAKPTGLKAILLQLIGWLKSVIAQG